jgi:hypothetical protein
MFEGSRQLQLYEIGESARFLSPSRCDCGKIAGLLLTEDRVLSFDLRPNSRLLEITSVMRKCDRAVCQRSR